MTWRWFSAALAVVVVVAGCPGSQPMWGGHPGDADGGDDVSGGTDGARAPDARPGTTQSGSCAEPAPPGAAMPPPLRRYSGGTCPAIVPGRNTIRSGGADRQFILVVPQGLEASEVLP